MLVCLNLYLRPRLYVMDGIIAMQGNGPRGGTARQMNVLLFSADPVALDATVCRMIDLDPLFVPTMQPAQDWGLGTYRAEEIEIVGDALESFLQKDFDVVRSPVRPVTSSAAVGFARNLVSPRPVIDAAVCKNCGTCVEHCPAGPKAVEWHNGDKSKPPAYKYERCIRCFCCQELCPEGAITVTTPLLGKLLQLR
jgi:Pyruvate/2-oxoacid:ferredoxin oxidoreductase delta subunit